MDRDDVLLRGRLALEAAEQELSALLELDVDDADLLELRALVRHNCDRLEAVQLDRAIEREGWLDTASVI